MKAIKTMMTTLLISLLISFHLQVVNASEYQKMLSQNKIHSGYIPFIYQKKTGKTYLLITRIGKQFLYQNSLADGLGSNDIGLDRGQLGETRLVQFEDGGNKILLRQLNTRYRALTQNQAEKHSVNQAFASSIIWGFPVIERTKEGILVDATDFLIEDFHGVAQRLSQLKQGNFHVDKSKSAFYLENSKVFPLNTELESTVTFSGQGKGKYLLSVSPDANHFSVRFHHTFAQLPDDGYQPRVYHPQSGYFPLAFADYATPIESPLVKRFITRHRLNKKHPELAQSEPVKPIIYYVDSGAPKRVRDALITGASWWNQAFEAIGYENAFQVKVLPDGVDPMDLRYNVIQWVHRSTRGWSYGASVVDPRTGEIIKGHVSLGSLRVRQDYLIAQSLLSPFKNKDETQPLSKLALARIRQLAAHEVGHTLGLAHNFAASVDGRQSVMDYPQPLIELVKGKLKLDDAYDVGIGEWDKQTIAYGYSDLSKQKDKQRALDKIIANISTKGLHYLSDPDARAISTAAPNANLWDNGNDSINEFNKMLKIRQFALSRFGKNSIAEGTPYSSMEEVLVPLYFYARYQMIAVGKLLGGYHYNYAVKKHNDNFNVTAVPAKKQLEALQSLLETLSPEYLKIPEKIRTLIPPKAYGYQKTRESLKSLTGNTFDEVSLAEASVNHTLTILFNPPRLNRMQQQHSIDSNSPGMKNVMAALIKLIKKQPEGIKSAIQMRVIYRIQQASIIAYQNPTVSTEVRGEILLGLKNIQDWMEWRLWMTSEKNSWYAFYQNRIDEINQFIMHPQLKIMDNPVMMPPGSPI